MIAGFDSPLPPARSGVAEYAASLMQAMRKSGEIVTYPQRADCWLYHVGNNREHHAAIYQRALSHPGVVVLHDAVLMHLLLGTLDEAQFVEEYVYNYGRWHEAQARRLWEERARSGASQEYYRHPMLRRLCESARAVVVHNPRAAELVAQHAGGARVVEIPHFAPDATVPADRVEEWRKRCGFAPGTYVFGLFGHLRESKRVLPALRAFQALGEGVGLVVAGRFQSPALAEAARPFIESPAVRTFDYLEDESDLRALIAMVDCGLSLRWPSAGETSAITLRLMAAAKPVIVTKAPEVSRFPDGLCVAVETGPVEEPVLVESMNWLKTDRAAGRRMGAIAREWLARHHSLNDVAAEYWKVLRS